MGSRGDVYDAQQGQNRQQERSLNFFLIVTGNVKSLPDKMDDL